MFAVFRAAIVSLIFGAGIAFAATQSGIPAKFNIPWGNNASGAYIRAIPQASQIGITNCAASLTDGFPPLTFTPAASGGCPPFGQDFNGALNQITLWNRWQAMGGPVVYDSAFSTSIGGYPKGAIIQSSVLPGRLWISQVDNNSTNPDDQTGAAANWTVPVGVLSAGSPIAQFTTTIPAGQVSANGLTVGNASSNATDRANADTYWLFVSLWTNCPTCNLFNSGGGGVGRGASAQADWAANDAIATVNMNGAGLIGADSQSGTTSTNLVNVPVTSGSRTVPTSILGSNLTTIVVANLPPYTPTGNVNQTGAASGTSAGPTGTGTGASIAMCCAVAISAVFAGNAQGGTSTPLNTTQRSVITYWNLSL